MNAVLAALTSWVVASTTPEGKEIETEGRLVYAYAPSAVVAGGVEFAAVDGIEDAAADIRFGTPMRIARGVYWQGPAGEWSAAAGYLTLLSNGFWTPQRDPKRFAVTLHRLVEGRRYLVQLWFNDMRPPRAGARLYVGEAKLATGTGGARTGTTAVCRFVASGAEETFQVGFDVEGQLNAIQVRDLDATPRRDVRLPPAEPRPDWTRRYRGFNPCWTNDSPGTSYSSTLPTAALLGNGSLGLVNGGEGSMKRLVLTRGDLWSCGRLENGFTGVAAREIMPLSFADCEIESGGQPTRYVDRLDIATATMETRGLFGGAAVRLRTFVASDEDAVLIDGIASRDAVWRVRLKVHDEIAGFPSEAFALKGGIGVRRRTLDATGGDPRAWTTNATAVLRVLGAELFAAAAPSATEASAKIRIFAGERFALAILPSRDSRIDWRRFDGLRARHCAWWREWWGRSDVHLGDAELERYYFGSLYLLGSGARPGKFPPGLYGLWQTTDSPLWHNDYHLNYNYIAPFFGCCAANRPEVADSLPDPLIAYLPRAEANARDSLRKLDWGRRPRGRDHRPYVENRADLRAGIADAALFPVGLGPWGVSSEGDCEFLSQTLNGPYQAAAFCTHWEYTRDRNYLRRIYPLLDKIANFYQRWCEREELPGGRHRYVLWDSWSEGSGLVKNCGQTLGAVRHVFATLVDSAPVLRELGVAIADGKVARWRDLAENLSALPTGLARVGGRDRMVFSTYETGDGRAAYVGGGGFELEPLNVGDAFAFDATAELRAIATNTVNAKLERGGEEIWAGINQTPKLFATAIRAGFPARRVIEAFKQHQLAKYGERNFTLHDRYHGFEKVGAIEFVNSMLLQSDHGYVKVFPNWTGADASFDRLRAKGAFVVSSAMRGGRVVRVLVASEQGGRLRLVDPWAGRFAADRTVQRGRTRFSNEPTLEVDMRPGETLEFRPAAQ